VLEVRQRGLMVGIELAMDPGDRRSYDAALRMGHQVICRARERGVIIRPLGDVVVLMPPLAISEQQIDELVEVTATSIDEATSDP